MKPESCPKEDLQKRAYKMSVLMKLASLLLIPLIFSGMAQRNKATSEIDALAFSADGHLLALSRLNGVELRDLRTNTTKHRWDMSGGGALSFSRDSRYLAFADDSYGITIWDLKNGYRSWRPVHQHSEPGYAVGFSPSRNLLVAGGEGGLLWIIELQPRRVQSFVTGEANITGLAFSPDGHLLAIAGTHGVMVWMMSMRPPEKLSQLGTGWVSALSFSSDGKLLATVGENGDISIFGVPGWKLSRTLPGSKLSETLEFFHQKNCLISEEGNNGFAFWDTRTWTKTAPRMHDLKGPFQVSSDDSLLAGQDADFQLHIVSLAEMNLSCEQSAK
jgi:WD40 repeat protein